MPVTNSKFWKKFVLSLLGVCGLLGVLCFFFSPVLLSLPFTEKIYIHEGNCVDGKFDVLVCKANNMTITVRYLIPFDKILGKPPFSASQMVFYAPFNGEAHRIRKSLPDWVRQFASKERFSVFSFTIEVGTNDMLSKYFYYIYREAGWYDLVFKIKCHLEKKYGLENRKLLVTGESSGGSWCQQLIAAYPGKVARGAWCGGRSYVPFSPEARKVPMLSLNIQGCPGEKVSRELAAEFTKRGGRLQHCRIASYLNKRTGRVEHHAANYTCYVLMRAFLAGQSRFNDLIRQSPDVLLSH